MFVKNRIGIFAAHSDRRRIRACIGSAGRSGKKREERVK